MKKPLRQLEVMRLEAGRWALLAAHAGTDIVCTVPFVAIDLELGRLWADTRA